jgi:hypothetical protein
LSDPKQFGPLAQLVEPAKHPLTPYPVLPLELKASGVPPQEVYVQLDWHVSDPPVQALGML